MPRRDKAADEVIHQALHGYGHGHELLASSEDFDDEIANILSNNSDSAPNARVSDGPYLTGHGLPDGRYVLARTWHQTRAERPNTVLTRSLLLPGGTPPGFSAERLLDLLDNPPQTLEGRLAPLHVDEAVGTDLTLTRREATEAARYYRHAPALSADHPASRDRIALGIWKQLWRSARYTLQFCTAPDTERFSRKDRALKFEHDDHQPSTEVEPGSSMDLIIQDLESPGLFREFLHFVGSGERAVSLVEPFAQAFLILHEPAASLHELTELLTDLRGTEPRRLRRLKRRFLSFVRDEPRWVIDPFTILEELAEGALGHAIYASDASLDRWLRLCWELNAERTANLLPARGPNVTEQPTGPPTASEGIAAAFATQASDLIGPNTLAIAVTLNPDAAMAAVWDRNESQLWAAWSDLEPPVPIPASNVPAGEYRWSTAVAAIRDRTDALSRLLRQHPEALDAVITLATAKPGPGDGSLDLSSDAKKYIRGRLEGPDPELVGLARLSDHRTLPRELDVIRWKQALVDSDDDVLVATGYLIAREGDPAVWEIATLATAALYRILAADEGAEAWSRLTPHLRGDRSEWDRCGRLMSDFAVVLRRYDDRTKVRSIALLRRRNQEAAEALERSLRPEKSKKFKLLDPTTWI